MPEPQAETAKGCDCHFEARNAAERGTLRLVLLINAVMFVAEFGVGLLADSAGLIADSLDMLADALVYSISLYAVGRSGVIRRRAAIGSGVFQIMLAFILLGDVVRRFVSGSEPVGSLMMVVASIALVANIACLKLLAKHRRSDVNMRASWIFSTNDVLANLGVLVAGALVMWSGSKTPDLMIGAAVASIVVWGGVRILRTARGSRTEDAA